MTILSEIARRGGGECYRCGNDPCTCGYEDARKVLVARLREIGAEDARNGYTALADAVAAGEGVHVDSWIAMELIADAEQQRLKATDAAIGEALRWLNVDNASGTGYVTRIWEARKALQKVTR